MIMQALCFYILNRDKKVIYNLLHNTIYTSLVARCVLVINKVDVNF